jgi:RNA polymerase sigma-B factor
MSVTFSTSTMDHTDAASTVPGPAHHANELINALAALPDNHARRTALRDQTIQAWLPMARRLAYRYANRGEPIDDLVQTATVGLIKAIDRFDPHRGAGFSGYAIPTIVGEIRRYFRDRTWSVRVPRRLQELRLATNETNSRLTHHLGRAPTVAEIAADLNVTEEDILEGLEAARAYTATSLSAPATADHTQPLGDTLGTDDLGYELTELHLVLQPALAALDRREQRILALRFYGNQTQSQIAEQIGISQMHVSRLIAKALAKLRHRLGDDADPRLGC